MSTRALTKSALTPSLFDEFFKPWNEWFDDNGIRRINKLPAVNVTENGDHYNVSLAAPGLKKRRF